MRERGEKRLALRQLAERQPAKGVGASGTDTEKEKEQGEDGAGKSLHSLQEELCQARKRLVWAWRFPGWLED